MAGHSNLAGQVQSLVSAGNILQNLTSGLKIEISLSANVNYLG